LANAVVTYVLKLGGDLAARLPSVAANLDRVQRSMSAAATSAAALGSKGRAGLNSFGEGTLQAAEGAGKALAGMAALGVGIDYVLRLNKQYERSSNRLIEVVKDLGVEIADTFGPTAKQFLDNFGIGLAYIGTLITRSIIPSFKLLKEVMKSFTETEMSPLAKAWSGDYAGAFLDIVEPEKRGVGSQNAPIDTAGIDKALSELKDAHKDALAAAKEAWVNVKTDANPGVKSPALIKGQGDVLAGWQAALRETLFTAVNSAVASAAQAGVAHRAGMRRFDAGVVDPVNDAASGSLSALGGIDYDKMARSMRAGVAAGGINQVKDTLSGGFTGLLSALGPAGAIASAAITLLRDLPEMANHILDALLQTFITLPKRIAEFAGQFIPRLIRELPKILEGLVTLAPLIIAELVKAVPAILQAFGEMLVNALRDLFSFGGNGKVFGDPKDYTRQERTRMVASAAVAQASSGGNRLNRSSARGEGGVTINAVVHAPDPRAFAEQLRRVQGPYGTRVRLDPYGVS
jgi:hypothetical protein